MVIRGVNLNRAYAHVRVVSTYRPERYDGIAASLKRLPNAVSSGCPNRVYDIMMLCWESSATKRPTFDYLHTFFATYATDDDVADSTSMPRSRNENA